MKKMETLPINIDEKNLSFKNGLFYIRYNEEFYKLVINELSDIKYSNQPKKLLHYLLTKKISGIESLSFNNKECRIELSEELKPVTAQYDPEPEHSLKIYSYDSLQSIQWHMLRHGVVNYWLDKDDPAFFLEGINKDIINNFWLDFQKKVNCKRWGIHDFANPAKTEDAIKSWNKLYKKLKKEHKNNNNRFPHGCADCVHNLDKFLQCLNFFSPYRKKYIEKLKIWIEKTIKDKPNEDIYLNNITAINSKHQVERRHVHMRRYKTNDLHAFVIDDHNNVFKMVFQQKSTTSNKYTYMLKTAYGVSICPSKEAAKRAIFDKLRELKKQEPDTTFINCCHQSNWSGLEYCPSIKT